MPIQRKLSLKAACARFWPSFPCPQLNTYLYTPPSYPRKNFCSLYSFPSPGLCLAVPAPASQEEGNTTLWGISHHCGVRLALHWQKSRPLPARLPGSLGLLQVSPIPMPPPPHLVAPHTDTSPGPYRTAERSLGSTHMCGQSFWEELTSLK